MSPLADTHPMMSGESMALRAEDAPQNTDAPLVNTGRRRTGAHLDLGGVVLAVILLLTAARLVVAANAPLAPDEALYWRYSKHLAPGFMDHPFMNPLMIRIGTTLFGDTPLGVRMISVLSSLPASWAVWRAAGSLFRDKTIAMT